MCFFSIPRMIIPRNAGQGSRRIKSRLSWHYLASPRKNILINIIIFHQIQERPQPFPLYKILERFQISPEQAIYVGDSLVDYKTAKAAGVPLVSYKNTELKADYHVDHLMDIAGSVLGIGSGI